MRRVDSVPDSVPDYANWTLCARFARSATLLANQPFSSGKTRMSGSVSRRDAGGWDRLRDVEVARSNRVAPIHENACFSAENTCRRSAAPFWELGQNPAIPVSSRFGAIGHPFRKGSPHGTPKVWQPPRGSPPQAIRQPPSTTSCRSPSATLRRGGSSGCKGEGRPSRPKRDVAYGFSNPSGSRTDTGAEARAPRRWPTPAKYSLLDSAGRQGAKPAPKDAP